MLRNPKLKKFFLSDWFIALYILVIFLLTNNYTYGWDDQHLEITALKHLIDPALYSGDYYVESVTRHFTSWLYPILSKLITVEQIPAVYFILYLISRYFLFLFVYKLWFYLSKNQLTAFACTLSFILMHRTEEFLYRTFSHQEFALAIIMAGIYYFFKNRLLLAAFILGVAANFHALYSLFPMIYLLCFALFFQKERRVINFLQSGLMFTLGSLPYLALYLPKFFQHRAHIDPQLFDHLVDLYLLACPQNFIFNSTPIPELFKDIQVGFSAIQAYLYLTILYLFLRKYDEDFRANKHVQASLAGAVFLLIVSFIFTYIIPVRLVLDFNLIRNEQFARFFLTGFLVVYAFKTIPKVNLGRAFLIALMIGLLGIKDLFGALIILLTSSILSLRDQFEKPKESRSQIKIILSTSAILVNLSLTIFTLLEWELLKHRADRTIGVLVVLLISYFIILMKEKNKVSLRGGETDEAISKIASLTAFARNDTNKIRWLLILLPIVFMFYHFANFHLKYLERRKHPTGFWQLQNNWEDMQRYVKAHTPKDAMLLVPYNMEMGGFRIHSERKVLVCYRDCGIVGFDYLAALEWKKRISDIEAFKVFIEKPLSSAIVNAITKYKVDYMVFMKYAAPPDNQILKKLYQNEVFVLYKVGTN